MKKILIVFILSFFIACASQGEMKTPARHTRRIKKTENSMKKPVETKAKKISYSIDINPFLTKGEEDSVGSLYGRALNLNLSAVFYSPPNNRVVIDGRILKEGDTIDDKTIKEIRPETAILKDSVSEYILKMGGLRKINSDDRE